MRRILMALVLFFCLVPAGQARIGYDLGQCRALYGHEEACDYDPLCPSCRFHPGRYVVICRFYQGHVARMMVASFADGSYQVLEDWEIKAIVELNSLSGTPPPGQNAGAEPLTLATLSRDHRLVVISSVDYLKARRSGAIPH